MGNKIVTEADRKRTAAPPVSPNFNPFKQSVGQTISRNRGVNTRGKKNPGKRPHQG